jgi:hypothetical protein
MATSAAVGQTATLIPLPNGVPAVFVLNSSGGVGDRPGAPYLVVNVGLPAALSPQQVGIRLNPGEFFTFGLLQKSNGAQLPLYAVASGPGGQVEIELIFDPDIQ